MGAGGRTPDIHGFGAAWPGNQSFRLEPENAVALAPGVLVIGVAPGVVPALGITWQVDFTQPVVVVPTATDAAGKAVVRSATLCAQFAVADQQAAAGVATSRGLRFEVVPK